MADRTGRIVDWLFRDRRTGRIVIVQRPNVALGIFLVVAVARRLADPTGAARTALGVLATTSLLWWAVDEVVRGVNPWRRLLGAAVLAATVLRVVA